MGAISASFPTVHLVGVGKVGRSLLRELSATKTSVIAVSDSSGTLFHRDGVDLLRVLEEKERNQSLLVFKEARKLPLSLATELIPADCVIDATPSQLESSRTKWVWYRRALERGASVITAAKDALATAGSEFLNIDRVGFNAALGGTGLRLAREISILRKQCESIAVVGNASTTALIEAFESGSGWEQALETCQARGILEPDPSSDLDGTDAAIKLTIAANAVFGWSISPELVQRENVREIDPKQIWWRAQRGRTTRFVARADRSGLLRVSCEEISRNSPLAVPSNRVAYSYRLNSEQQRLHVGFGIGPLGTARAILSDYKRLSTQGVLQ